MAGRFPAAPLLLSTAEARGVLGWGRDKFRRMARQDPDFPRPWASSEASHPQYVYAELEAYVLAKSKGFVETSRGRTWQQASGQFGAR